MGFIIENEEDGANVAAIYPFTIAFLKMAQREGTAFDSYFDFKADHVRWWVDEQPYRRDARKTYARFRGQPAYFEHVKKQTVETSDALYRFSERVSRLDLPSLTDEELAGVLEEANERLGEMLSWGMLATYIEFSNELVTQSLSGLLAEKSRGTSLNAAECAALLSTPDQEGFAKQELLELLGLAGRLRQDEPALRALMENAADPARALSQLRRIRPQWAQQIDSHARKYGWVYFGYGGPAWSAENFIKELLTVLHEKDPDQALHEHQQRQSELHGKRSACLQSLALSAQEEALADLARDVMYLKTYRKEAMIRVFFSLEPVHQEFARRSGLSMRLMRSLYPQDYQTALGRQLASLALERRFASCVYGVRFGPANNPEPVFLEGKEEAGQRALFKEVSVAGAREVRGTCAQPGHASGIVRLINTPSDLSKMNKGDVLVSIATTPDLVPAMRKASAIVTDIGGLTCHAAIVSRELGVPCIVGAKIATRVFHDGDLVDVDATNGIVRRL